MPRYKLPSGATVTTRELNSFKGRDTKAIMRAMGKTAKGIDENDDDQLAEAGISATDELIAFLVTDWAIPYPTEDGRPWLLPKLDKTLLDELEGPDYGVLIAIAKPAQEVLMPRSMDPGDYEDLDSPTAPASA